MRRPHNRLTLGRVMLESKKPVTTLAVQNLERAKQFYEGKLGLKASPGRKEGILLFETGGAPLMVYESRFAGTNQATAVTWSISEGLAGLVENLAEKGV